MPTAPTPALRVVARDGYVLTNHRALCRRGVMWIGQTCNLRCHFCYFLDKINDTHHPEHSFMALDKLKEMCRTLVEVYGNNSVDIQGGEPTIYRHILPLIEYCNEIGLKPTLISNGLALASREKCEQFRQAGVYDFLLSVHALGERHDRIVVVPGAAAKMQRAIANLAEIGVPFRFNTVLCQEALPDLMGVAQLAVASGARATNFIAFNPFIDQSQGGKRSAENVPRYSEVVRHLLPVIDYLDQHGIEVNVRYLPFCLFPEPYRKFVQNFQQIVYDLHEWESAGEAWTGAPAQRQANADLGAPVDFHRHVEALRLGACGDRLASLPEATRWQGALGATLQRLRARVPHGDATLRVSLFGSAAVGTTLRRAIAAADDLAGRVSVEAYVSGPQFAPHGEVDGLPWHDTTWLAAHPTDVVINTSESSRAAISAVLAELGLASRTIEVFGGGIPEAYAYLPYLPELGPVPGATPQELAYKEYRVLMTKALHPYTKEGPCTSCALMGICDGFHKDYVELFGFEEAEPQILEAPVYAPMHYGCEQLKVVEEQELDWALPPAGRR